MAYLVMARKWRPQAFDEIVGQKHVSSTLKKAIQTGRVAHAYLFCGTRGVGKTTTARILAKALNCEKGPTPTPCGVCPACKEITAGSSMDVIEIDGASNRGIDDIRTLRENVRYASMQGRHRVFIIDEVHMVTTAAFNALLKTLEEPPPNVVFIFATTEPMRIPQTILSRCQRFDFRRIPTSVIHDRLQYICRQEKVQFQKDAIFLIAKRAEGSMRDALSLLDQVLSSCNDELNLSEVSQTLGLVGQEFFDKLIHALAQRDKTACMQIVENIFRSGYNIQEFVTDFADQVRYLLFAKVPEIFAEHREGLSEISIEYFRKASESFSDGDLLRMASWVNELARSIRRSNFPRFEIELCLLKMVNADRTVELSEVIHQLRNPTPQSAPSTSSNRVRTSVRNKIGNGQEIPSQKKNDFVGPVAPGSDALDRQEPPPPRTRDVQAEWPSLLDEIMREKPIIGTFLSHATVGSRNGNIVEIRFSPNSGFQLEQIKKQENKDFILEKLRAWLGQNTNVRFVISKQEATRPVSKPGPIPIPQIQRDKTELFEEAAEKEPILNQLINLFDGEIIDT